MQTLDSRAERNASLGDRAVIFAGLLALIITGFFGADPEPMIAPTPTASAAKSTPR